MLYHSNWRSNICTYSVHIHAIGFGVAFIYLLTINVNNKINQKHVAASQTHTAAAPVQHSQQLESKTEIWAQAYVNND